MSASTTLAQPVPLTPTQLLVISDAARRCDGGVVLPERLKGKAAERLVQALTEKGLVGEVRGKAGLPVWRKVDRGRAFALVLTKLGRATVPTEPSGSERSAVKKTSPHPTRAASPKEDEVSEPGSLPRETEAGPQHGSTTNEVHAGDRPKREAGSAPRPGSKLDAVITLLGRDEGASVEELMAATGWLPHTTRAALTGLRKRGFAVTRERADDGTSSRYRIHAGLTRAA